MKYRALIILLWIPILFACNKMSEADIQNAVPALEEVSGIWVSADTVDMEPSVRNFRGQALLNRDMSSVSWLASAPYSGGYHSGVLRINGQVPLASMYRWLPHQALRKGEADKWKVFSTVKMLPDRNVLMWQLDISNGSDQARTLEASQDLIAFISKYGGDWQWWYPYPKLEGATTTRDEEVAMVRQHIGAGKPDKAQEAVELIDGKPTPTGRKATWPSDGEILGAAKYQAELKDDFLVVRDSETEAVAVFAMVQKPGHVETHNSGGTASWTRSLDPGESVTLNWILVFGDREQDVLSEARQVSDDFKTLFAGVDQTWEDRWHSLFDPEGELLSGCFPVLQTDDAKARKVYYTGPLTMLYLMHTNLPEHEKVFLTGGPRWGASITFFWDITEWSSLWAVVDPAMMKEHLSAWIDIDPSIHYGKDNFGGKGVGNGYSANFWALFQMVRAYISTTGDLAYLDEQINGKTVLQHLDTWALNWKNLSPYGKEGFEDERYHLADFGDDEWNLLECVPTYKHIVPSFNAGYIWMMRELASMYELRGESGRSEELRTEAGAMLERLLQLYAGEGVWNSLHPGGELIEVRHCLDFMFLGRYLPDDIPEQIRDEMMDFVYRELITDRWMRAQSLKDVAAERSDRADHGPLGAFDGWPAGTMDALTRMGFPGKAMDFYHAIEPVTYEGCWAQAHELWGEDKLNKNSRVRIAQRGWHNRESSSGIAMSQVMLKDFFGFYPAMDGQVLERREGLDLDASLYHVYYQGEYYSLHAANGKVKMRKEQ